ncbi:MAG: DUF4129 domain-containing protein [Betaproteobacteria bacterium]|nr:DUF4129 domain-containing protein [Betaproteobacteria bacterium]
MQPDKLAVALRPRSGFEAIDLGLRLAQRCARPLFLSSLALVMSVCALAYLIFAVWLDSSDLGVLFVWWLKPLYDRLALHVLSRGVFDATPGLRETLRALPSLVRHSGLFAALSWQRFDTQRALRLPVAQLEGLRGAPARARRKLLSRRVSGSGIALLFCFVNFEALIWFGVPVLIAMLIPGDIEFAPPLLRGLFGSSEPARWISALWFLSYGLAVALVEPFYLAGGFGLYLKRRTDLEAWDVELQMRRLTLPPASNLLLGVVLALALTALQPGPAMAADEVTRRESAARQAPTAIKEVLARPEFGHEESVHRLRWKSSNEEEKPSAEGPIPAWLKALFKFWAGVGKWIAEIWRVFVWILLGLFGCLALWFITRQILRMQAARRPALPPAEVAGLDIRPDSLPDDIAAAAQALFAQGRAREGLALLYRGALSRLAHRAQIPFARGDTEGDCLLRVTRAALPMRAFFADLTHSWQSVAYADRQLPQDQSARLCRGWAEAFGALR